MKQIKTAGKNFRPFHGIQSDATIIPRFMITDLALSSGQNG